MVDLFFYGTLRYVPLLERVLGRSSGELTLRQAVLEDHAVFAVKDQPFPMIMQKPGVVADGLVAQNLNEDDLKRLEFYEGGFDYSLQTHKVSGTDGEALEAQVFFPDPGLWTPDELWSLNDWIAAWGPLSMLAADEVMEAYGRVDPTTIAQSFQAIRTRAWARLAARGRASSGSRNLSKDVIVTRRKRAYLGYFGLDEIEVQHRLLDGTMGPTLNRSGLMQGSAVVVLPYDPVRDCVLLVEQFRAPVFLIDDPDPWMWEPVAGMIDPGETPESAARREAIEEAHVTLSSLEPVGGAYSSSGSSTEYLHLFVGLADLTDTVEGGGLATEGEDIRSKILPYDEFIGMVDRHEFKDLPLVTLAHWLARHRDRLRS